MVRMLSQYLSVKLKMMMMMGRLLRSFFTSLGKEQEKGGGGGLNEEPPSHLGLAAGALIESLFQKQGKHLLCQHISLC